MPIKLYNFVFGPYPQRINIYLAEKNPTNVELIIFDEPYKQAGMPPAAVKELTPTGSMPILEDDDSTVIGQSLAILEYLEDKASDPDMHGATPAARARTRQFVHVLDEALTFFGLCLERSPRYHGMFPHFINGRTGATIPFSRKDDGGDVVESAFLFQGLLCARQYFDKHSTAERELRHRIDRVWLEAEWDWYRRDGENHLYWHWSPKHGWSMNRRIGGWNEGLLAYVLAAGSPEHAIDADVYHQGFASGPGFRNGRSYHGIELPLGMDHGGPLFIAHYSFCGLDPRGLSDRHADYWQQNVRHTRINYEHCVANPHGHAGYGPDCWGLTSSHGPKGYVAHAPGKDIGVITPSAALSSLPYAPDEAMRALRYFLMKPKRRIWGRFGFVDAFCESRDWYARTYLAINQGPIVIMIENFAAACSGTSS